MLKKFWVLDVDGAFVPQKVIEVKKNALVTDQEPNDLLFEDHGWLWRATQPKDGDK